MGFEVVTWLAFFLLIAAGIALIAVSGMAIKFFILAETKTPW